MSIFSRYCVNILTYVMFKTKNVNLKLHPLTKRIVQFKQMLEEMAVLDERMKPEIQNLLTNTPPEVVPEVKSKKKKSTKKKLKILDKVRKQNPQDSEAEGTSDSDSNCIVYFYGSFYFI